MSAKIFINYRREDEAGYALALQLYLAGRFPASTVFMDVAGSIEPGDDFVEAINRNVGSSIVLLAIFGSRWLTLSRERSADEMDFTNLEIASALNQGKLVVPVLINDAPMPSEKALPPEIGGVARRHAVRLRHESFGEGCSRLAEFVERRLRSVENITAAAQAEAARAIADSPHQLENISLPGTVWKGHSADREMVFRFLDDGVLRYTSPSGTFDNGLWTQDGSLVVCDINDHYAIYTGKLDGRKLTGSAVNKKGRTWSFELSLN
jgi:hypothetical protein